MFLMFFAACGGGKTTPTTPYVPSPPSPPPEISINISPAPTSVAAWRPVALTVTPQNVGYELDAPITAGCGRVGSTVTCTPAMAGTYEVIVTATADRTKTARAVLTVVEIDDIEYPEPGDTKLYGINDADWVIGTFFDHTGVTRAFLKNDGGYAPIFPPDASGSVYVSGINDIGHVLGYYEKGYFLKIGTAYEPLENYPGLGDTYYTGINAGGQLSGYFTAVDGYTIGFVTDTKRLFVESGIVEHPSAAAACALYETCGTWVTGLNNLGHVTGVYLDSGGVYRGFVKAGEQYIPIVHPNSAINTYVSGINDTGHAVGYFWSSDGYASGFMTDDKGGLTDVVHPDAAYEGDGEGTYVYGINNSGRISGWFDDGERARGFLLTR